MFIEKSRSEVKGQFHKGKQKNYPNFGIYGPQLHFEFMYGYALTNIVSRTWNIGLFF